MEGIRRVTCTAIAAFGLFLTPASSSADVINGENQFVNGVGSVNWSGYLYPAGSGVTAAAADWVVPQAHRHDGQEGHSSAWVGVGGVFQHTLIQAGTQSDVDASGRTTYFAWWEQIPDTQHARQVALRVRPGNHMHVSVDETAPGNWTISILNLSTGRSFSTTTAFSSTHDSAEWIIERPMFVDAAGHVSLTNLPELRRAQFDNAMVNGRNANLSANYAVQMLSSRPSAAQPKPPVLATPSAPDSDANGFSVCVYQTTCATPASGLGDEQGDNQGDNQD